MSRTPNTPFIPQLLSPHPSPQAQPSPVIPSGYSPAHAPVNYPVYPASSPYTGPGFIPPSPSALPNGLPRSNSGQGSRQGGLSADYTGYPQGSPYSQGIPHTPAMATPATMPPAFVPPPFTAPWPQSAPPGYTSFGQPTAGPWPSAVPSAGYVPSPYVNQNARVPFMSPYSPYGAPLPAQAWPPPQAFNYPPPQPHVDPNAWAHPPQLQHPPMGPAYGRPQPEPPSQVYDRMDPFTPGLHYGPVLDPFLVKIVQAPIRLHPLISPPPEDGPDKPYLKWDMRFSTATVIRSDEPAHMSWMRGRDYPATFPRLTSLRIMSTVFPWMIDVKAKDKDRGVTCGEVIDAIAYDLNKLTIGPDFENASRRDQPALGFAYKFNRSADKRAPGGMLGQGMKRLDFLRVYTLFGGIEVDNRTVKRLCGSELPCVFLLRCREPVMTSQEAEEQDMRMRNATTARSPSTSGTTTTTTTSTSRSASRAGVRPRANSNARITVHPPSTSSYDSDSADVDR